MLRNGLERWAVADTLVGLAPVSERQQNDKHLRCASCGDGFVFSCGEQELFRLRGITSEPAKCPDCARGQVRKLSNGAVRARTSS
ncbi:MAG TPA: zinc-ribbon domain containing protein [Chloroflexota bacterium]